MEEITRKKVEVPNFKPEQEEDGAPKERGLSTDRCKTSPGERERGTGQEKWAPIPPSLPIIT